jgi:hypothetical protein
MSESDCYEMMLHYEGPRMSGLIQAFKLTLVEIHRLLRLQRDAVELALEGETDNGPALEYERQIQSRWARCCVDMQAIAGAE